MKTKKEFYKFSQADVFEFTKALGTFLRQTKASGIPKDTYRNNFSYTLSNGALVKGGRIQGEAFTGSVFKGLSSVHNFSIDSGAEAKKKIEIMFNSVK
jgi:hypothetical protein